MTRPQPTTAEPTPVERTPVVPHVEERPPKLARGSSRVVTRESATSPRSESPRDLALRGTTRHDPTLLAAVLLAAYLGLAVTRVEIPWLAAWQRDDWFERTTGGVLVVVLAVQWLVARRHRATHLWLGAFAPVFLYVHAMHFAYGYLVWLAAVYLGVGGIGLAHRPILARRARRLYVAWFIAHLALSVGLLVLVAYHVVIVIAYE